MPTSEHELSPRSVHSRMKRNQPAPPLGTWDIAIGTIDRSDRPPQNHRRRAIRRHSKASCERERRRDLDWDKPSNENIVFADGKGSPRLNSTFENSENKTTLFAPFHFLSYASGNAKKPHMCGEEKYRDQSNSQS
ncbi:uncharacterized protein LOC143365554 [Halictus rubicundus]|uniref:uncharacterized protein LOC143365554 n=1 Tax=Halictus rubicundus TaxID=77578 RepID=UPI004035CC4D